MRRRLLWAALLAGVGLSLAVSYRLAAQSIVFGSRPGNWFYGYVGSFDPRIVEVFLIVGALSIWMLVYSWAAAGEWRVVCVWCFGALALQGLLRSLTPFSFHDIFANDAANSFLSVALKYDTATILGDFDRLRSSWPLHAQSNLPGKVLLVRALTYVSTDPGTLAWIVVAISNLGGALVYRMVRDLFNDRRVALVSLALYLFVPGKLFFFPLLNTVTPVFVFGCACLLMRWLASRRVVYAVLLGAAVYLLALFEPGALVVGLLFAALMARSVVVGDMTPRVLVRQTAAGAAAFAAIYAAVAGFLGFDLADALRGVGRDAANFNVQAARPYEIWVRQNVIDFVFGAGILQAFVTLPIVADGLVGRSTARQVASSPIVIVCLSLIAMLAAVDLIGVNRGEVIRLWIFLGCLFQIPAAYLAAELDSRTAAALIVAATLLQNALGSSMVGFIVPG